MKVGYILTILKDVDTGTMVASTLEEELGKLDTAKDVFTICIPCVDSSKAVQYLSFSNEGLLPLDYFLNILSNMKDATISNNEFNLFAFPLKSIYYNKVSVRQLSSDDGNYTFSDTVIAETIRLSTLKDDLKSASVVSIVSKLKKASEKPYKYETKIRQKIRMYSSIAIWVNTLHLDELSDSNAITMSEYILSLTRRGYKSKEEV